MRMMIVGTPSYFDARPNPTSPQDLLKQSIRRAAIILPGLLDAALLQQIPAVSIGFITPS
jgi:hypothetical protein